MPYKTILSGRFLSIDLALPITSFILSPIFPNCVFFQHNTFFKFFFEYFKERFVLFIVIFILDSSGFKKFLIVFLLSFTRFLKNFSHPWIQNSFQLYTYFFKWKRIVIYTPENVHKEYLYAKEES